jgi:hypothetical protein
MMGLIFYCDTKFSVKPFSFDRHTYWKGLMWLLLKLATSLYQAWIAAPQFCVQSGVIPIVENMYKFWPTLNLSAIESVKCRSEFHKLPLALFHSAYRLASSYEFHHNFTWPVGHSSHSAMISTAHPIGGPTALTVALAGCCNFSISPNVHLMYRSYLMTTGEERPWCYVRFLPDKFKTAKPTLG